MNIYILIYDQIFWGYPKIFAKIKASDDNPSFLRDFESLRSNLQEFRRYKDINKISEILRSDFRSMGGVQIAILIGWYNSDCCIFYEVNTNFIL